MVKRAEQRQQKTRWNSNEKGCALQLIKLKLEDWTWCRHDTRVIDVALTRLITDAVRLKIHMLKLNLVDNDMSSL